jgi:hypothetical protein
VDADIQHPRIIFKHLLGPVAVMDIPVDDRHPRSLRSQVSSGNCNVVQKAKTHGPVGGGVVTRWPNRS